MHEQSETIQLPDGRWINVYGRGTARAGPPLSDTFSTMEEAVSAARVRSATTLTDENTAHAIGLKMNPLYQDQLFSGTATTAAPTGTASAPISRPPVQRRDLRRQAVAGMGSSDRIGSGLQEVGAALQGKSSPLDQRIAAEQQERLLGLQELKVHTEALQDGVKLATKLKGNTRKQFVTQYAEQLEGMRPGLGAVYQTLSEQEAPSLKFLERSPTLQRAFEVGGEDAVIKLLSSPESIKTINAEIDSSVLPTLHKKGQTILMGWQQLVPPAMVDKINADERVTASEFLAVNEWIKENKPEFAAATFSDEDLQILSRNEAAFYGALGILPPSEEAGVIKEGVKKGADVALTKEAANYADNKLQIGKEVVRQPTQRGEIVTDPAEVSDIPLSKENDPEWHRARAEFFRTKGRDDLADAALKQADQLKARAETTPMFVRLQDARDEAIEKYGKDHPRVKELNEFINKEKSKSPESVTSWQSQQDNQQNWWWFNPKDPAAAPVPIIDPTTKEQMKGPADFVKMLMMAQFPELLGAPALSGEPAKPAAKSVTPGAKTGPAPAPPIGQRKAGTVYQTPKGPLKWTGKDWTEP